jgi:hypothetical protein
MAGYGQKAELNQVLISEGFWSGVGQKGQFTSKKEAASNWQLENVVIEYCQVTAIPLKVDHH